jgi:parallel beta-helix repeat protein
VVLNGLSIKPASGDGILVEASRTLASDVSTTATIGSGLSINGGTTGLVVSGAAASIAGDTLHDLTFTGQTGQYIDLMHGALAGSTLDATGVTFDGHTGATATLAQNFAIEDKIQHAVDDASLGFVRVKAGNVFVTTASGSIQRGVNVASAGDTVNVNAGTYHELVTIDKSVALDGVQHGVDARTRTGPETIVSNSEGDFQIEADNVTIDGFTLTGVTANPNTDPAALGAAIWTNPGFSGTHGGHQIVNNIITGNIAGIELDNDGTYQTLVQHNLFKDNTQPGPAGGTDIVVDFGLSKAVIDSNTFTNTSFVENAYGLGVQAGSDHITFSNNTVDNHGRGVYFYETNNASITNNTITGASHYAVGLFGSNGLPANSLFTISNNTLDAKGSGGAGVELVNDTSASAYSGTLALANFGLLVTDVQQQVVKVAPGMIHYGDTKVAYDNVGQVNLNNAIAVNALPGPDTADRASSLAGLTADERFVQALYLDDLGRAGSKAELDAWVPALGAGQQAVAQRIESSFEARDHLVKSWYQTYLGRAADGTEETGLVNMLVAGQTEEQVLSLILGSQEFHDRAQTMGFTGTADQNYVQALYQVLLDRTASSTEVAGWGTALSQVGRQGVALDFLQSQEFRTYQFEGYYNVLLRRPDDPTGLKNAVVSAIDMSTVRVGFESGGEFFTNG